MAGRRSLRTEIETLAAELGRATARSADGAPEPDGADDVRSEAGEDLAATLDALKQRLDETVDEARDLASDHPVVAISAAFLLGILVGRLWRL